MNHAQIEAIAPALTWLQTLINSPAVDWSAQQHQAATEAFHKATIHFPTSHRLCPFVDVTKVRNTGVRYLNTADHSRYVRVLSSIMGLLQVLLVPPDGEAGTWHRHSYGEPLEVPPRYSYQVALSFVAENMEHRQLVSVWEETK